CVDLATAQQTVLQHNNKHAFEIDGKKYTIKIQMEDGAVDVRLHDLPEEITNDQVKKFMSAYGEILSVRELVVNERLKDAKKPTGKSSYADALMTKPSPRFVPAVLVEDNTGMDCDGDNAHTDAENFEMTTEGDGSSGGGSGFAAEPGIIIQDGGSSGGASGPADMLQKTTPILQETIIRDGDQLCVFKTPLTLPQDGDGAEESDGSSTSSASGKRPRGRPPKKPKTST
ncbi:hypothetical protein pipiens_015566, partial [Culex pipiens pipiens]